MAEKSLYESLHSLLGIEVCAAWSVGRRVIIASLDSSGSAISLSLSLSVSASLVRTITGIGKGDKERESAGMK